MSDHPRDRYLVVAGRKPVVEALRTGQRVAKVHLADGAHGPEIDEIRALARHAGVTLEVVSTQRVTSIARTDRHHQGVVADVVAERMAPLDRFLEGRSGRSWATQLLVVDRVHNPANLGMILRVATAAGMDGIVVPAAGTADLGAVTIKASAGVAFRAPILRVATTEDAVALLADARVELVAVDTGGEDLFTAELPSRVAYVLGNETDGLGASVRAACTRTVSLPLHHGVESLNVATTAAVVAYELLRRRSAGGSVTEGTPRR